MLMDIEWGAIFSIITFMAVIIGIIVNIKGLMNRRDEQVITDTLRDAKLDSILDKVIVLTADQKGIETTLKNHSDRLIIAEETYKSIQDKLKEICADFKEHNENENNRVS